MSIGLRCGDGLAAGQATTYGAVYDLASSTWCTSNGTSGAPTTFGGGLPLAYTDSAGQLLYYTDSTFHPATVSLTALTAGTKYCVAITASNPSGAITTGAPVYFTAGAS